MTTNKVDKRLLTTALSGFFIMGFCDIVPPLTGAEIANEFPEELQGWAWTLPSMVFLWFFLLAVPIAAFMNRKGKKTTAYIGYFLTCIGLFIPFFVIPLDTAEHTLGAREMWWYYLGFGLLGLGNTFTQVAINPLLASIVPSERMTSYLTIGQIFRNTALLLVGPLVILFGALTNQWRWILLLYGILTVLGILMLRITPIKKDETITKSVGYLDCFRLLKNSKVLLSALGIACFIAGDVGISFVGSKLIGDSSILTTTGFYACRIVGTLVGASVLIYYSDVKYLRWNMALALTLCLILMTIGQNQTVLIYGAMGLMGFMMSCVFATFYAVATKAAGHAKADGVAGLMIMAISAGALACPACGYLIDLTGTTSLGFLFSTACILYMFWASWKLKVK